MTEEYVDPEFPEMEIQPEEIPESEGNSGLEVWDEGFCGEIPESEGNLEPEVFDEECQEETSTPDGLDDLREKIFDEVREQADSGLIESYSDAQEVFSEQEYPPRAVPTVMTQDSGGVLFLPDDDPIRQPVISEPLDPRLVYTRSVPRRLRHLTCERRGSEYQKPSGLYRPGG
jgi:hypothetical protein